MKPTIYFQPIQRTFEKMTEVEIASFSTMFESFSLRCDVRGTGRQARGGKNTANVTQGLASFTGSVSDGVGVEMETGVGVRVAGLDSTNKLSVTNTGW